MSLRPDSLGASGATTSRVSQPRTLSLLCAIPAPVDLPRFDAEQTWQAIAEPVAPLVGRGQVIVDRLVPATESVLKQRLGAAAWQALHFVGHAQARAAAHYGTLAFEASDGRGRQVTASYFSDLLAQSPSLKLVVLQGCTASDSFEPVAEALLTCGLAVITSAPLPARAQSIFVAKLYGGLLAGLDAMTALTEVRTAIEASGFDASGVRIDGGERAEPIFATPPAIESVAEARDPRAPEDAEAEREERRLHAEQELAREQQRRRVHDELARKRAGTQFDVFLCHNGADKPAVKRIATALKEAGILPWLDEWELPPGLPWQPLLETQIGSIKSAAVFVGSAGVGPWQEQELLALLREFVSRKSPVIPVLLEDAPLQPELPIFLRAMTWVDFRSADPDPLKRLIWGITGQRPGD
jgi:hypothetical protein